MSARPFGETRLPPDYTRRFGVEELHAITFQLIDDPGGPRCAVSVSIPEASKRIQKRALALARARKARVQIVCDTADQARQMRAFAQARLPGHRFVALERVEAGAWALAS